MTLVERESKIRILYLFASFGLGGTDKRIFNLTKELPQERFEIYLNCYQNRLDQRIVMDHLNYVDIHFERLFSASFLLSIVKYVKLILQKRIDMIQFSFIDEGIIAAILKLLTRRSIIYHKVNCYPPPERRLLRVFKRISLRAVDHVIANSKHAEVLARDTEHIDPHRMAVIHNGIDTDYYRPPTPEEKKANRKDLISNSKEVLIGVVANLRKVKDHATLLRAVKLLIDSNIHLRVVLVGEGEEKSHLIELSEELQIDDRILFAGSQMNVRPYLWAMDIGVLTSRLESCSNSILEYMACGLPVVATSVGGTAEIVRHGITGYLLPPGNFEDLCESLRTLCLSQEERKKKGQAARKIILENFSSPVILSKYIRQYELIKKRNDHVTAAGGRVTYFI